MQKQWKQLSDWLKEEEVKGQGSEDDDVINVRQEVTEVSHWLLWIHKYVFILLGLLF